ncbi:hypothetical protein L1987_88891 [Smallanthus sonchifolius]|nr:hypothetical protein L1987_88891 [Smallanthus sonchifolius]
MKKRKVLFEADLTEGRGGEGIDEPLYSEKEDFLYDADSMSEKGDGACRRKRLDRFGTPTTYDKKFSRQIRESSHAASKESSGSFLPYPDGFTYSGCADLTRGRSDCLCLCTTSLAVSSFARDSTGTKDLNGISELSRCYLKNEESATEREEMSFAHFQLDQRLEDRICPIALVDFRFGQQRALRRETDVANQRSRTTIRDTIKRPPYPVLGRSFPGWSLLGLFRSLIRCWLIE